VGGKVGTPPNHAEITRLDLDLRDNLREREKKTNIRCSNRQSRLAFNAKSAPSCPNRPSSQLISISLQRPPHARAKIGPSSKIGKRISLRRNHLGGGQAHSSRHSSQEQAISETCHWFNKHLPEIGERAGCEKTPTTQTQTRPN